MMCAQDDMKFFVKVVRHGATAEMPKVLTERGLEGLGRQYRCRSHDAIAQATRDPDVDVVEMSNNLCGCAVWRAFLCIVKSPPFMIETNPWVAVVD